MKKLLLIILAAWLLFGGYERLVDQPWWPGAEPEAALADDSALLLRDVEVRDLDGRVAWRGEVALDPVLRRIDRGERDPHRNDGGVFHNRERRLPERPAGHYREYVIRTPGIAHAGPQRLVIGRDGEVFYSSDHYRSFRTIR